MLLKFLILRGIFRGGSDDWLTPVDYEAALQINLLGIIRATQKFKKLLKIDRFLSKNI